MAGLMRKAVPKLIRRVFRISLIAFYRRGGVIFCGEKFTEKQE